MTVYRLASHQTGLQATFRSYVDLIDKLVKGEILNAQELASTEQVSGKQLAEFWRLPGRPMLVEEVLTFPNTLTSDYCFPALQSILINMLQQHNDELQVCELIAALKQNKRYDMTAQGTKSIRPSARSDDDKRYTESVLVTLTTKLLMALTGNQWTADQLETLVSVKDNVRSRKIITSTSEYGKIQLYINTWYPMPRLQVPAYRLTKKALVSCKQLRFVHDAQMYKATLANWLVMLLGQEVYSQLSKLEVSTVSDDSSKALIQAIQEQSRAQFMRTMETEFGFASMRVTANQDAIKQLTQQQRDSRKARAYVSEQQ